MIFLQATNFESSEVVLVHDAFHGRGEGGHERCGIRYSLLLVFVLEGDEYVACARDLVAGGQLAIEVGKAAVATDAHDFIGRVVRFAYNLLARQMKICEYIFA